jgi:regulator of protease activity HflC (stomatin/prohibitin superfamily)
MFSAVEHANRVTRTYGVEVMSINIISASPVDDSLQRALATGAVASAEALQAETQARGRARAVAIDAEAEASRAKIEAAGVAESEVRAGSLFEDTYIHKNEHL